MLHWITTKLRAFTQKSQQSSTPETKTLEEPQSTSTVMTVAELLQKLNRVSPVPPPLETPGSALAFTQAESKSKVAISDEIRRIVESQDFYIELSNMPLSSIKRDSNLHAARCCGIVLTNFNIKLHLFGGYVFVDLGDCPRSVLVKDHKLDNLITATHQCLQKS